MIDFCYRIHKKNSIRYVYIIDIYFWFLYKDYGKKFMNDSSSFYNSVIYNPFFQQVFESKTIQVIAPASGLDPDRMLQLQKMPYPPVTISMDFHRCDIGYHSNTDDARFLELKKALFNEQGEVIWTLRGGYGSARLITELNKLNKPAREKIFIGFSDNTALHLFFSQQWGWKTIHGCGFAQLMDASLNPENFVRLAEILAQSIQNQSFNLSPMNENALNITHISAQLQGGNLTLVECSLKTCWEINAVNKILFLEEVGEKGYRIDRSLTHLQQAGVFSGVKAIIFGECTGDDPNMIELALHRFAQDIRIPVYSTSQFGHGRNNFPFIYNATSEIVQTNNKFVLQMQLQ